MCLALGNPTRNEPALATLERDEEGFLLDTSDWSPDLIQVLSGDECLVMTPERVGVINCTRNGFGINMGIPEVRVLMKHLQAVWDKSKTTGRDLYQLFPRGYGQQACKISCTRIPHKLILDV
jgi:TusE/DsrC/DsvC family sulfur relay protein